MTACSIVIPVHDGADLTRRCLDALAGQDLDGAEIVVVDDASTDGTAELLAARPEVRVVRNEGNLGFAASCNAGVAAASGEHVVLLNNDTQPLEGWLEALVAYARAHPRAAVVGAKLLWPSGTVQHAGVIFSQTADARHVYAGMPGDHPAVQRSGRFQAVTGACMLVRRDVYEELGGFDTGFVNGYEDVDFCLRAGEAGHEVHYCHEAVAYHLESSTRGRDEAQDAANRARYRERWGARVRRDDVERYLRDGLLELSYDHDSVRVRIDPALGAFEANGSAPAELGALLSVRASQVHELRRENARLARATGWTPAATREPGRDGDAAVETTPAVSVVVVVDHAEPVREAIAALTAQTVATEELEVLVVHPRFEAPYALDPGPLPCRQIASGTHGGRAGALNRGIREARADLVILLVDDLIPGPGFVAAHLEAHAREPDEHVVGIGPAVFPPALRTDPFRRWLEDTGNLFGVSFTAGPLPGHFFWCANTSAKRRFLLSGEMFDERLPFSAWDDYELGRRLFERGMRTRFVPGATTSHEHPLTLAERRDVMHDAGVSAARFDAIYAPGHPWNTATDRGLSPARVEARAQRARVGHRLTGRASQLDAYYSGTLRAAFLRGYRTEAHRLESGGTW